MSLLTLNLTPELDAELKRLAEQAGTDAASFAAEALDQQVHRLKDAIADYQGGRLSLGAFAEHTGLGVLEADRLLGRLRIELPYTPGQAARDAETTERLLREGSRE